MAFNPNLPANHAQVVSQELRDQFNALKALIDAQETRIAALEQQMPTKAFMPQMGEINLVINNPPTNGDLLMLEENVNELLTELKNTA